MSPEYQSVELRQKKERKENVFKEKEGQVEIHFCHGQHHATSAVNYGTTIYY